MHVVHQFSKTVVLGLSMLGVLALAGCGGGDDSKLNLPNSANSAVTPVVADLPYTDPVTYATAGSASLPSATENAAVTHHSMTLNGKTISYTATAGHLTASAPADPAKPAAPLDKEVSFFYVAYTRDGQPLGTRPVTFFYNGGPGSSTIWLHLGSWGPKTLQMDEGNLPPASLATQPTSFPLIDNDVTMLDDSDLVFVDATGTGYSEAIAPHKNSDFWGVDADAAVFRDFIAEYVKVNNRQTSPKYLYGESYGGIRTPVLAKLIEEAGSPGQGGPALTGIIMNSPILSYKTNCEYPGGFLYGGSANCVGFFPSYTAVAHSRNKANNPNQLTLSDYVNGGRSFATQKFAPEDSLYQTWVSANNFANYGLPYTPADPTLLPALAGWTGTAATDWANAFDMDPDTFSAAILGMDASHMDAYNGLVNTPSNATYGGSNYNNLAFTNQIKTFLPQFLGYTSQSTYAVEPNDPIDNWNWNHGDDKSNSPSSIPDLVEVLTLHPELKTIVFGGYHDLRTPFHQTELDLAGAGLTATVPVKIFAGGHMIYLTKASRAPMKLAIDGLYNPSSAAR
ncbi:MAG: peptidase S10 [Collimonas sp.]|uniref:S10 family serine carboxypeptidase-like protein n=1 Tax=Collimonas sp. TaxID=1963772 RepID=UPI0032630A1C